MILYLSYDGLTDPLGSSQVLPYIKSLSKKGYKVIVVSFEKPHVFEKGKSIIADDIRDYNIKWVPLSYTKHPPVISTIFDILRLRRSVQKLLKSEDIKIIHCRSYITSIIGLQIKRKMNVPFIFDMRGFYADERVDGDIWRLENPLYKLVYNYFKKKEKQFLVEADHVISLTFKARNIIHSWSLRNEPLKISVIPTCVDTEVFNRDVIDNKLVSNLTTQLGIEDGDFVLSYVGSLGTWYMVSQMIDFYEHLLKKIATARFLILTKDNPDLILSELNRRNIPRSKVIIKSADRKMVPYFITLSNWSIFFIKPVFSKSASAPTKMGELVSMNVPFVCNSGVGDMDDLTRKYDLGLVVDAEDPSTFENAINYIVENRSKSISNKIVTELYSLESGVDKLDKIYKELF